MNARRLRKRLWLVAVMALLICLAACHKHEMVQATCTAAATCVECGETEGEPLGHTWKEATCIEAKICSVCGGQEGSPLGHTWKEATCEQPKTCSVCSAAEGKALGHSWEAASCKAPKTCKVCSATEGTVTDHSWALATCTVPKTCKVCAVTEGTVSEHNWVEATLEKARHCTLCGITEGEPMTLAEFEDKLKTLPMYVESTRYIVQDEKYKSLYPDMLSAVIKNQSGTSVKNAVIAFVAWDSNGFPVKIYGKTDFSGAYAKLCNYGDVNMVDGATFGDNKGMSINYSKCKNIATFKAIVVQYTDFDGKTWNNPLYDTWRGIYENKVLKQ